MRIYNHYWAENKDKVMTFYMSTLKEYKMNKPDEIKGVIHAAMTRNMDEHIIFADETNLYLFDVKTGDVKTYAGANARGLYFFDNKYCYTLQNKSDKHGKAGLYLYDMDNLIDNGLY